MSLFGDLLAAPFEIVGAVSEGIADVIEEIFE